MTVQVCDCRGLPPASAMGALKATVMWNGKERGATDTMWMGASPSWLVENKFNCRRAGSEDSLEVRLTLKTPKQKEPALIASVAVPWLENSPSNQNAGSCLRDAVLDGDKVYFALTPSEEYRTSAYEDCAVGILVS